MCRKLPVLSYAISTTSTLNGRRRIEPQVYPALQEQMNNTYLPKVWKSLNKFDLPTDTHLLHTKFLYNTSQIVWFENGAHDNANRLDVRPNSLRMSFRRYITQFISYFYIHISQTIVHRSAPPLQLNNTWRESSTFVIRNSTLPSTCAQAISRRPPSSPRSPTKSNHPIQSRIKGRTCLQNNHGASVHQHHNALCIRPHKRDLPQKVLSDFH